ncbi:hypothetical protein [Kribbella sp. NBC_00889]|uniref:hypothetical protein n=1 Tax=Kribbella sp. NBC_00889 TaxID=2975974 RepID=UPI00386EC13B|nr:hypothetical protein OG817_07350 [Kribbella sp. NBC_00889]
MSTPSEAVERRLYNALWWAKVQSAGPLEVSPDTPAVAGLTRAASPDGSSVWLVPTMPSGAGHAVLDELGTPPVAVEQPNETARVLAICVACCWTDRSGPAWPGSTGTLAQIRSVYAGMRGRAEQSSDLTLIIGSLRRLHATHWLLWNEKAGEVRLGPRVITWTPTDQSTLRDLCRHLPDPPPPVLATSPPVDPTREDPLPDAAATAVAPPATDASSQATDAASPATGGASPAAEGAFPATDAASPATDTDPALTPTHPAATDTDLPAADSDLANTSRVEVSDD